MAKELRRMETAYEDGTCWVEFETYEGKITYEMVDDFDEEVELLYEDKINIEDLPIRTYVESILASDDDLCSLFYDDEDEDSIEEFEEAEKLIEETLEMYPELEKYIEVYEDEIIFCGGLITKVLF